MLEISNLNFKQNCYPNFKGKFKIDEPKKFMANYISAGEIAQNVCEQGLEVIFDKMAKGTSRKVVGTVKPEIMQAGGEMRKIRYTLSVTYPAIDKKTFDKINRTDTFLKTISYDPYVPDEADIKGKMEEFCNGICKKISDSERDVKFGMKKFKYFSRIFK